MSQQDKKAKGSTLLGAGIKSAASANASLPPNHDIDSSTGEATTQISPWLRSLPVLVLLIGFTLSSAAVMALRNQITTNAHDVFDRVAEKIENDVARRFMRNERALISLSSAFKVKRSALPEAPFTSADLKTWVSSQDAQRAYSGTRGFGYMDRVHPGQESSYEQTVRSAGQPNFRITELSRHDGDHFVERFLEPEDRNLASVGLDASGGPERRQAILRAIRTGTTTLSEPVILVQDEKKTPGFIYYHPVYHESLPKNPTAQQRDQALIGLMFSAIVADELLQGVDSTTNGIDIRIMSSSGGDRKVQRVIYEALENAHDGYIFDTQNELITAFSPMFAKRTMQTLGGQNIAIDIRTNAGFASLFNAWMPLLLGILGLLLSIFLAALAHMAITANKRANQRAREITAKMRRLATVTSATTNAVAITDEDGRIVWVNEGFERLTGMVASDAISIDILTLLRPEEGESSQEVLARNMRDHGSFRGEMRHITMKHGERDVIVEMQPLSGDDGHFEGFVFIESDITDRLKAELALDHERVRLANVIEASKAGIWEASVSAQWVHVDDRLRNILGYPINGDHDGRADAWMSLLHEQDRETLRQSVRDHIKGKSPGIYAEVRILDGAQQWRWVLIHGMKMPLKTSPGELWLYGSLQDITERKLKDAQLLASRAFLDATGEVAGVGGWRMDFEADQLHFTSQTYRIFEWRDGHPIDLPKVIDRVCSESAKEELIAKTGNSVRHGEPFRMEVPICTDNGIQKTIALFCQPQFDRDNERVISLLGAAQDVTSRKDAENAVRKSDALLRGAIDAFNEAFVVFDENDRLVFCNEKYRSIYTLLPPETITYGARYEDILIQGAKSGQFLEAVGREKQWVEDRLHARQSSGGFTGISYNSDGRVFRVIDQRMSDGHSVGFRIEITDLVRATEEAQEASKAKSQFLANMSHEIRTPMNAILGMLSLMVKTDLTDRQKDYVLKTERAAKSLLGLLNDILDFSKVEAGKMTLDPHPFLVEDVLQNLSVILSATAAGKKIEVLYDVDPALPRRLIGDSMRLQQVLINLGGNAVKFTAQGEVVIALEAKTPVTPESTEVTVEFSVKDTGIGIAQENIDKIFSGFTQAEASTTRRYGGTGLGVAICQRLIKLMGSELKVRSVIGQGSCFYFSVTLPIYRDDANGADVLEMGVGGPLVIENAVKTDQVAQDGEINVLIIDDSATARAKLKRTCESAGWKVQGVASGQEGIDLVRSLATKHGKDPFDLIIVDWQMPEMDGWQTCRLLRNPDSGAGQARILMVTAQTREMLASRAEEEQSLIDGFVVKPVTLQMLQEACGCGPCASGVVPMTDKSSVQTTRLQGLRILVAEDNQTNQQVAKELLEDEGALVEIAENGEQAVQSIESGHSRFDVVLMDLQMPVMDGFAATKRIREHGEFAKLPIIAMTANAMFEDRRRCLASGMDEHVGKPFDLEQLVAVIRKFSGLSERDAIKATPGASVSALPDHILAQAKTAGLEIESALHRMGDKLPTYRRLMRNFIAEMGERPTQLMKLMREGQFVQLSRQIHTLKGLTGTLGLTGIARMCASLEHRIRESEKAAFKTELYGLCSTLNKLEPLLEQLHSDLEKHEHEGSPVKVDEKADVPGILTALHNLSGLLVNIDMEALIVIESMRGLVWGAYSSALQAIDDDVVELKFTEAHEKCVNLIALMAQDVDLAPSPS